VSTTEELEANMAIPVSGQFLEVNLSPVIYESTVKCNGKIVPIRHITIDMHAGQFADITMTVLGYRAKEVVVKGRLISDDLWERFQIWEREQLEAGNPVNAK
jgi:hypothetical protein